MSKEEKELWNKELERALREQQGPKRGELYGMDTEAPWPVPAKKAEQSEQKKR